MKYIKAMSLAAALCLGLSAHAIPAKPGTHIVTQPDGSTIELTLAGDEYCHYYLTTEGAIVLPSGGAYYMAATDADGRLVPSSTLVTPSAQGINVRSDAARQAIGATRSASVLSAVAADEAVHHLSRSTSDNPVEGIGLFPGSVFPRKGEIKGLIFLVQYSDVSFSLSDDEAHNYFSNMLNQPGFDEAGATGSAYDFFIDASAGQFVPQFDVYGPVTLSRTREYYGGNNSFGNDAHADIMIKESIDLLTAEGVDFSPYDNDGDGVVDNIFVFYAGVGEAQTGLEEAIWPHSSQLTGGSKGYKAGDMYFKKYACSNELLDTKGTLDGIGTFVHEFSHVMGLPDLYNTVDAYAQYTPSNYSVLDQGPYNNNSRTPPTYSAFERNAMGWLDALVVNSTEDFSLEHILDSNKAVVVTTNNKDEFFLFENRQKHGWDAYIPYHGMLVWHIDYKRNPWNNNSVNNNERHQYVDLVEAGGKTGSTSLIRRQYPFPGSKNIHNFTPSTDPAFVDWNGNSTGWRAVDITETNEVINVTFEVDGPDGIGSIVAPEGAVTAHGRTIVAADGSALTVLDYAGRTVATGIGTAQVAAPGLYIVVTAHGAAKLTVK